MKRSSRRLRRKLIPGLLAGGAMVSPGHRGIGSAHASEERAPTDRTAPASSTPAASIASRARTTAAVIGNVAGPLSDPGALETAFRSYYAFQLARPDLVRKPLLYFVDYGLPADQPRGFVFDMAAIRIVEGPFLVAHGRGSAADARGVPTRFSNRTGSHASSLGLFLARETYPFRGVARGRPYRSIGLRLQGLSGRMNDNAAVRHVVAHGAPYVTTDRAGRSEGCPALAPDRAERLLPQLANGGLVFLFSPRARMATHEPWAAASSADASA